MKISRLLAETTGVVVMVGTGTALGGLGVSALGGNVDLPRMALFVTIGVLLSDLSRFAVTRLIRSGRP